jgi:signal transduction histidine kinase
LGPEPGRLALQPWLDELLTASAEGIALFDPAGRLVRHNARFAELFAAADLTGAALDALSSDPTFALALAAARGRGRWQGRLRLGERELDARLQLARDGHGALLCHDVSQQVALASRAESLAAQVAEQASRAEDAKALLFEQTERLTSLYQITVNALESATVRDTATRICAALIEDLGAANAALWLLDGGQGLLRLIAAAGPRAGELPEVFSRAVAPQVDEALASGRALPVAAEGRLAGFAAVPLPGREQPLGLITLDHAPDLDKVQVYAPHVATAINNAIMADELARANTQLRAIDQQKSEFLNFVAHDLRTPLTCIRTYTDLLKLYVDEPPETYREFLTIIAEETERLGELLDNFLDLARIESATMRYEREPVDLAELAAHFRKIYLAKAAVEAILLAVEVPSDLPRLNGDRRRLAQVFANLLANAFKFTPRGGTVQVRAGTDGAGLLVQVDDTGPGVPADDRQRIFERFRQARNADRSGGGTGLGLAIARAIVSDHGGRIWVEDAPGGGARFAFWLPLAPPPESAVGGAP